MVRWGRIVWFTVWACLAALTVYTVALVAAAAP